jgi:FkbM family methyltransferase
VTTSEKGKDLIRATFRRVGLQVARWNAQSSSEAALSMMLSYHGIDTVLDVGANEGQYARVLRELGFRGRIISFEPLSGPYQRLRELAAGDDLWVIAPQMALGTEEGQITVNISSQLVASSVLPMGKLLEGVSPQLKYVGTEVVPVSRLDTACKEYVSGATRLFLKVDVQGYELEVLRGAADLLRTVLGAQLELSFVTLYEGQALFSELVDFMRHQGFEIWGIIPGLVDNSSGRLLQADGIFFRV